MSHIIKTHAYCLLPIRSLTNMAQKSKDEKQTYEHYIKPVKVIDNFEEVCKLEHRLIRSYDELYNFYKNEFKPNTFFAWDTETTSLNAEQGAKTGDLVEGKIVGYSFTQDGHIGYYVPVSHPDYSLGYKALKILYAMICRSKLNLLYNCRFDMRFLEAMTPEKYDYTPEPDEKIYKFDLSGIKYIDVQNTVWLADTNLAMPSLKKSEKHFLGWNPPTFSETIGDESNFGYLPAEQGYKYASIDALGTYHLFFKTEKYYAESGAAAKLDNDLLYPLMRLENTPINVDHDYLQSMRGDVLKHLEELKKYLFETAGREYNINSGRELVTVLQQLGIDTGKRTKTGIMETNIKAIEGYVASHGDSEYLNKLVEYKKLLKFDNSYLEKMLEMSEAENVAKHPIRFCYFTNRVPTGRLASGTDGKNSFFSKLNFQSIPKPHSHNYHVHKATPEQIANGEDLCGYIFNDDPEGSLGLAEGQDPHLNVRKAFCPIDNDSVVVSVDMCLESGSPVQTKRGYMGIGELKVGDEILTPDGYVKVLRVKNTGLKKLYKVNTDGQSIYCSEDHPFMINNEQVPANHIDHILVQETFTSYESLNPFELSTPTSAYLLGYIFGDNSMIIDDYNHYKLTISSTDYNHIKQIADIFGNNLEIIICTLTNIPYWSVNILDQSVCHSLLDLGIKPRNSHIQPNINYNWIGSNIYHFIRGLIDSTGSIYRNGNSLNIELVGSTNYINEVYKVVNGRCVKESNNKLSFEKLGNSKDKLDFYSYLYKDATIWLQRKRDKYDEWIIDTFKELPSFEMYDITIDSEDHVYLCNGVRTHNCAEELRLVANIYKEQTWIKAFNSGQDVHRSTACKIFGEENYCKEARKKAKAASFGILYGSSAYGFHNQFPDMTLEECEEFIEKFKAALPSIEAGQKASVRYAKKNGFVKTYFGRPRRVKYYLNHPDRSMRSFGERTVKNTAVQGAAGDCLKLMLIRLWKELFSKYPEIKWVGSIHDEITYIIPKSILIDALKIIKKCQTIKLPDWPVQLDCDISIGRSFGELIPWFLDDETGELTPQLEEIKHEQVEEKSENKVNEYDMLLDADEYDYLQ